MTNLTIWDALKTPPATALKPITGGRLVGMTDISPQWRYYAMTEQFGPVGIGWYYKIVNTFVSDGAENEKVASVSVEVFIKDGDKWSQPIPGMGGSKLVANERNGPYTSDEAFKMADTDALSVAFKKLGVGADVYMGNVSTSKYSTPQAKAPAKSSKPESTDGKEPVKPENIAKLVSLVEQAQEAGVMKMGKKDFNPELFGRWIGAMKNGKPYDPEMIVRTIMELQLAVNAAKEIGDIDGGAEATLLEVPA